MTRHDNFLQFYFFSESCCGSSFILKTLYCTQDVSKPFIQLRLGVRNPDTDTVERVAFNMTVDKFKVLLHGLSSKYLFCRHPSLLDACDTYFFHV